MRFIDSGLRNAVKHIVISDKIHEKLKNSLYLATL